MKLLKILSKEKTPKHNTWKNNSERLDFEKPYY